MSAWEYRKIDLNEPPRGRDEIDLLCEAGDEGWELVAIQPNSVAYLKRELDAMRSKSKQDAAPAGNGAAVGNTHDVKAKYRDPKTNETWSGRGRMANWLKRKQDAGEDIDDYLI